MTDTIRCQIRVRGHLSSHWADWFEGLEIENRPDGQAVISGSLSDQAALYGILKRIRNLGLTITYLYCIADNPGEPAAPPPASNWR